MTLTMKLTKRSVNQAKWYTDVVLGAKLADYSPVRGCIVFRPYGYAIWEKIQQVLGAEIKASGAQSVYFPLLIPYSFIAQEQKHLEGFAPEMAIVTHTGKKELEEKLVIRPTSETIINKKFTDWVQSYRDLPLKVNQWCNIVRWEKRTVPFLRTLEFLWQEGHTIHATRQEAETEVYRALDMYYQFATNTLAMHVTKGLKTEKEKFAGAEYTTTIEGLMADGKALQCGTSHMLGQNFAKAFDTKFVDENNTEQYVWQTSWGLSTRVIGGIILMHGDDNGLILPPNIAPIQIQIVPIFKGDKSEVAAFVNSVETALKSTNITYETDWSDNSPGWKFADGELRGIPIRLEIGPKEAEEQTVTAVARNTHAKTTIALSEIETKVPALLSQIQTNLLAASKDFTEKNTHIAENYDDFLELTKNSIGYIKAFFDGNADTERKIQEETKYTTRCIPLDTEKETGKCFISGKEGRVTLFAKAY